MDNENEFHYFFPTLEDGYLFYDYLPEYGEDNLASIRWRNGVISGFNHDMDLVKNELTDMNEMRNLANYLKRQQVVERKKELQILEKFYGIKPAQGRNLLGKDFDKLVIKSLNQIQGIMPQIQRNIQQLRKDEEQRKIKPYNKKGEPNYGQSTGKDFSSAAHQLQIQFEAQLKAEERKPENEKRLLACLKVNGDNLDIDETEVESIFKEMAYPALLAALNNTINKVKDKNNGDNKVYTVLQGLLDILKNNSKNPFVDNFINQLDLKSITDAYKETFNYYAGKTKRNNSFIKNKNKQILKPQDIQGKTQLKTLSDQNQGFVEELLNEYLIPVLNANQSKSTKAITSRVSKGHSASADLVTVLVRTDITIDFEKQIREQLEAISGSSKIEIRDSVQKQMYKISKMNLSDYAVIWESTKSYILGSHLEKSGIAGVSQNYRAFKDAMDSLLPFSANSDMFLAALVNTSKQTLGENASLNRAIRTSLARVFAAAMFDDPQELEKQVKDNGNVIHVFRISGIVVPLSYLLTCAARAVNQTEQEIQEGRAKSPVKINLRREGKVFLYRREDFPEDGRSKTGEERWSEQREQMESAFNFTITFGANFRSLLQGELGDYLV